MKPLKRNHEKGNSILEFAIVATFLVPMLAASFTLGMLLVKGIQVGNVCRDADVLFVRSITDPRSGLDLSQASNQAIIVRAAQGLGMKAQPSKTAKIDPNNPDPNGKGVVILSKIVHVKDLNCAAGNPKGTGPWSSANCPNYDRDVFASRIVIGNGTTFDSQFGDPGSATATNGNYSASDIANNAALLAPKFTSSGALKLADDAFALVSEMYADVSALNVFSTMKTPVLYARNIS